ncbi:MAG: metal-dependent transcriptional regulator [Clostridiaceae bacterium]|jgi:Mn-dependent DtxR family transcriptional regulator|nr:metal-dependent transcriptional regulator [Clostridiaceae bacterium]NLW89129.1 metal-dependent transcriptional regulator [Clostridiaceae bacterium]
MEELSIAMQNYLETIYELSAQEGGVRVSDIAAHLGVSKASVNNAINVLSEQGYVSRKKYQEIYLTGPGAEAAAFLAGKHSVLKSLFTEILGVPEEIADRDACAIEHIISRETILQIQKYLRN